MNGIALGVAMLVYTTGISPAMETARAAVAPAAFSFELPDATDHSRNPPRLLNEQSRLTRLDRSLQPAQATPAKRRTKTARIIAVAAGAFGGFMAGGMIGYAVTQKAQDDDGVSGLRGVVVGAPIGAVVGALIGYRLTK